MTVSTGRFELKLPDLTGLDGPQPRGTVWVASAGKAPKLRFQPGSIIQFRHKGKVRLFEVICAYRVQNTPSEWHYWTEERDDLFEHGPADALEVISLAAGVGRDTPRVVTEIFGTSYDAMTYFADIPKRVDWQGFSNGQLIAAKAEIVSSGVLSPAP